MPLPICPKCHEERGGKFCTLDGEKLGSPLECTECKMRWTFPPTPQEPYCFSCGTKMKFDGTTLLQN